MADETQDRKAADAEAAAEVKTVDKQNAEAEKVVKARKDERGDVSPAPAFANTVPVAEKDFPSVEDTKVNVLRGDDVDPNEGWTAQSETPYVDRESIPGSTVRKHELPTIEGLEAHGIDPVAYVAGVAVTK
jgi:hypothetical protein